MTSELNFNFESSEVTSAKRRSFSLKEWIVLILILMTKFALPLGFACMAPFFNTVAKEKNLSISDIGQFYGIFNAVGFFAHPCSGRLVPILGTKKLFVIGTIVTGLSTIALAYGEVFTSRHVFYYYSMFLRIIQAIGNSFSEISMFVVITKNFPNQMTTALGIGATFTCIGFSIAHLLGGILFEYWGYKVPFVVFGAFLLVISLLNYIFVDEIENEKQENIIIRRLNYKSAVKLKDVWLLAISIAIAGTVLSIHDPTLPVAVEQFNLTPIEIGMFFQILGMSYALAGPFIGAVMDYRNFSTIFIIIGNIGLIISMSMFGPVIFLPFQRNLNVMRVGAAIQGLSEATVIIPCLKQMINVAVQEKKYPNDSQTGATISGIVNSFLSLGTFVGPFVATILLETFPYDVVITIFVGIISLNVS
uniref:MFS domain-containing protein n=1 Tax=Rhabditophanes sp. KR3021 TaxID=114890 RepID=A0AC35U4A4_9BILA